MVYRNFQYLPAHDLSTYCSVGLLKVGLFGVEINPHPNKPNYNLICIRGSVQTPWQFDYHSTDFNSVSGSHGYTPVFELELFNGVVDDVTGSRVIPEIDMAVAQTGSKICLARQL